MASYVLRTESTDPRERALVRANRERWYVGPIGYVGRGELAGLGHIPTQDRNQAQHFNGSDHAWDAVAILSRIDEYYLPGPRPYRYRVVRLREGGK